MSFSIRLTKEEKELAESYAKLHSVSVGEAFKQALFEKIEDEYDVATAEIAYKKFKEDPNAKVYTFDELCSKLEI